MREHMREKEYMYLSESHFSHRGQPVTRVEQWNGVDNTNLLACFALLLRDKHSIDSGMWVPQSVHYNLQIAFDRQKVVACSRRDWLRRWGRTYRGYGRTGHVELESALEVDSTENSGTGDAEKIWSATTNSQWWVSCRRATFFGSTTKEHLLPFTMLLHFSGYCDGRRCQCK